MRNRKLFHLLSLLSDADHKQFDLFLASPFFNSSPMLQLFWAQWKRKVLPLTPEAELSVDKFVAGSKLNPNQFDALCWKMTNQVREFLAQQAMARRPQLKTVMYTSAIMDRAPGPHPVHRLLPELEKELATEPESPEKHLMLLYHHAAINQAHSLSRKTADNWKDEFARMLQILQDYAHCKHLELACGAVNAAQIFRQKAAEDSLEQRPQDLQAPGTAAPATVLGKLYQLTLSYLLETQPSGSFAELLRMLEAHRAEIADAPRNDILGYVLNCCIRKVNRGHEHFMAHTFSLYRLLLKNGDLLEDGLLPPQQFKNLVALACRLHELDWARQFMDDFRDQLTDAHAGLALRYNEGVLAFYAGRYADAIAIFKPIVSEPTADIFYGLDARSFLWKSYFEHLAHLRQEELDDMFHLYDSFRLFIHRHEKISSQHKAQYKNFVRLFKKFMQCLEKPIPAKRRDALRLLQKKLTSAEDVPNRSWFLQKVADALADCA